MTGKAVLRSSEARRGNLEDDVDWSFIKVHLVQVLYVWHNCHLFTTAQRIHNFYSRMAAWRYGHESCA
jgi:hypothetical protein